MWLWLWISGLQILDLFKSVEIDVIGDEGFESIIEISISFEDNGFLPGFGLGGKNHFLLVVILIGSLISNGKSLTGVKADVGILSWFDDVIIFLVVEVGAVVVIFVLFIVLFKTLFLVAEEVVVFCVCDISSK